MAYTSFCVLRDKKEESAREKVGPAGGKPSERGLTFIAQGCPGYSGDSSSTTRDRSGSWSFPLTCLWLGIFLTASSSMVLTVNFLGMTLGPFFCLEFVIKNISREWISTLELSSCPLPPFPAPPFPPLSPLCPPPFLLPFPPFSPSLRFLSFI